MRRKGNHCAPQTCQIRKRQYKEIKRKRKRKDRRKKKREKEKKREKKRYNHYYKIVMIHYYYLTSDSQSNQATANFATAATTAH